MGPAYVVLGKQEGVRVATIVPALIAVPPLWLFDTTQDDHGRAAATDTQRLVATRLADIARDVRLRRVPENVTDTPLLAMISGAEIECVPLNTTICPPLAPPVLSSVKLPELPAEIV